MSEQTIDYDVVSEFQGHQKLRGIQIVDAAKDLFGKAKEKAMQVAVKGEFIEFGSIEELQTKLEVAAQNGFSIRCYDEVIGG